MQNWIQQGNAVPGLAPYAITSGQGAIIGNRFGVATDTAALGAVVPFVVTGVIDIAKDTSAFTDGQKVYFNATTNLATSVTGSTYIEIGAAAIINPDGTNALGTASGDATVRVLLTPSSKPLITSADLDPTVQQSITVVLTAAQIIAMEAAPVNVIPAPLANQMIIVDSVFVQTKPGATAFTAGGAVSLQYHGTAVVPHTGTVTAAQILSATAVDVYLGPPTAAALVLTTALALGIDITNATAPFATGNGTVVVTVWYSIVTNR